MQGSELNLSPHHTLAHDIPVVAAARENLSTRREREAEDGGEVSLEHLGFGRFCIAVDDIPERYQGVA